MALTAECKPPIHPNIHTHNQIHPHSHSFTLVLSSLLTLVHTNALTPIPTRSNTRSNKHPHAQINTHPPSHTHFLLLLSATHVAVKIPCLLYIGLYHLSKKSVKSRIRVSADTINDRPRIPTAHAVCRNQLVSMGERADW